MPVVRTAADNFATGTSMKESKMVAQPSFEFGHLLCLLGLHKYRLVEVTEAFGPAGVVEKVECERCKVAATRMQANE